MIQFWIKIEIDSIFIYNIFQRFYSMKRRTRTYGACNAVAGHYNHVFLVCAPLLEDIQAQTCK